MKNRTIKIKIRAETEPYIEFIKKNKTVKKLFLK